MSVENNYVTHLVIPQINLKKTNVEHGLLPNRCVRNGFGAYWAGNVVYAMVWAHVFCFCIVVDSFL